VTLLARLQARLTRADDGFTLAELLVVTILIGIVGAISLSGVIAATNVQRHNDRVVMQRDAAQTAVQRMGRDFVTADPLTAANATDVTMRVYRGTRCEQHRWYVNSSNQLVMTTAAFAASTTCTNATGTPGTATSTVVARDVVPGSTVFSFFRWDRTTGKQVSVASPVASTSISRVDRVVIALSLSTLNGSSVTEQEAVDLRNVEVE